MCSLQRMVEDTSQSGEMLLRVSQCSRFWREHYILQLRK